METAIGMKTTDYMGSGGVQLAGNAILMNALPKTEAGGAQGKQAKARGTFPVNFLTGSLLITAATVAWTSYNFFSSLPSKIGVAGLVSAALLAVCLSSWFITARAMLLFNRAALHNAGIAAHQKEQMLQEHELMRLIIDHLPDCIYAKDVQGRFLLNNNAHAKDLGAASPAEMIGKSDFDFFPKELAIQFYSDEQRIIETGKPIVDQEQFKEVHINGKPEMRWSHTSKVLWRDRQGRVIGTAGITRDINQSKLAQEALRRSEEKLRHFTMQLERSNRELQDFAYVASHDLQEPLRKIVVFGERLKDKCTDNLPPEACDYIDRMQKAAGRMQVLISDLLSFSRVTTKAQPFTSVDLSRTVREVVGDLEARIELVKGRVEVGPLPLIQSEPLQMRQLVQNLIGNALKFRRPEEPPVVKVEATLISAPRPRSGAGAPAEELCQLTVSDNGIGFDEKYLDRIFNVFQRLHTRNEYEGTGMGLAIARKIVLYHGGDITAKSKPGHGSTFIITLPVTHPKDKEAHHE